MSSPSLALDVELDLGKVLTIGSVLSINADYDNEVENTAEEKVFGSKVDFIGQSVESFADLKSRMRPVDEEGLVMKKVLEDGGGLNLNDSHTVYISYSGYWENDIQPFEVRMLDKPLVLDLKDSGLLPGLEMAVRSMLVGEISVFLLSYKVMYGVLGVPPRIKPKADCVFYIKLVKCILTPQEGEIDFSEPNTFKRVFHEVKLLYASGVTLHKSNNNSAAINLFRKAVFMLHKCRLADEQEEEKQEKMLKKLYTNLAICYNLNKQPLKACTACNEMNRLNSLWNNGKVLFQNAKSLRMIGEFDEAQKKLTRAQKLCPNRKDIEAEFKLLEKTRQSCNRVNLITNKIQNTLQLVSEEFKQNVDIIIKNFKENDDLCKLVLPEGLNCEEIKYVKEACARENLFCTKIKQDYALDKEDSQSEDLNNSTEEFVDLNSQKNT